ncbi:DUF2505 domain-containing protein [Rhodococcus sp. NPDC058514]|uniref:DUF2505 domain-containing protein n=1 Tax=unclassified Rhodococcus (in: high G+C Gram-positive bacteria) TaxID=192944 RepID=UPI00366874C5
MARSIPHSAVYPQPVDQVHRALTSERYWRDRLTEVGGDGAELGHVVTGEGTIDVEMAQSIPAEHLPAIVSKIRPGDLIITRTETWGALDGDRAVGTFSARVEGLPGAVTGTLTLAPEGTGSAITLDGQVEVKLPLIGGKIEAVIAEQVVELLDAEHEFTEGWISANG